jgi:hypothetical protein
LTWPFVKSNEDHTQNLGIGKLISNDEVIATIQYFDSPTKISVEIEVSSSSVEPSLLMRQTRAYYDDPDQGWRVGRVIAVDEINDEVYIRFPGMDEEKLNTANIYVRWQKPVQDPSHYLSQFLSETSLFSESRHKFMATLNSQRKACKGLSALISSRIELHPHQILVIQKVLQDPVQRYLLADEVGLGKTIEAGVIIRQRVLDNPRTHKIIILVPPQLRLQWREEMETKFSLTSQLEAESVLIIPSDDPDRLNTELASADMIVIDEAHHVGTNDKIHRILLKNIQEIPSVILLTATPVLNNEKKYLQILNLLDPVVYSLDRTEEFSNKIKNRQKLAGNVSQLVPSNIFILDAYIADLKGMFPSDAILASACEELGKSLANGLLDENDPIFLKQLNTLKSHVSETYRLDRRILRNRRQNVEGGLTPERVGVHFLDYSSSDKADICARVDHWRTECMSEFYGREDAPEYLNFSQFFADLVEASAVSRKNLLKLISDRENVSGDPAFASEAEWINSLKIYLKEYLTDEDRVAELLRSLEDLIVGHKVIIFCNDQEIARDVTLYLRIHAAYNICHHNPDKHETKEIMGPEDEKENWRQFLYSNDHPVLVCGDIAEEGLNLQGGNKCIIHFDLPFNPNRIEQRIGRLDRFGDNEKIKSFVIRCTDDPYEMAWSKVLDKGLSVFDRSIASLQYIIEEQLEKTRSNFLNEGEDALKQLTESLSDEDGIVSKELEEIRNQEILDSLESVSEEDDDFMELDDVDSNWQSIQDAIQNWACKVLQLRKMFDDPNRQVINFPPFFNAINLEENERETRNIISTWLGNNQNEKIYDQSKRMIVPVGTGSERIAFLENAIINYLYQETIIPESQNQISDTSDRENFLGYIKAMIGTLIIQYGGARLAVEDICRFKYDPLTSLIPANYFAESVSRSVIDNSHPRARNGYLTFPYTARRLTVTAGKNPKLRLLRYGEELISSLTAITEIEDRGKSSALWRQVKNYTPKNRIADLFFRCGFLIEADCVAVYDYLSKNKNTEYDASLKETLRRRGDMVFPGFYETIWLDEELNLIDDKFISENLTWQYGGNNTRENHKNWDIKTRETWQKLFSKLPDFHDIWQDLVLAVPEKGKKALILKTDLSNKSLEAVSKMKAIDERRFAQLNTRIANPDSPSKIADQVSLKREKNISKFLEEGVKNPKITLDAIAGVFLSNQDIGS